jgi:hypothetical protein
MRIDFEERIEAPVSVVYSFFRTPADWVRLYGSFGTVRDRGGGWFAVPLRRFPFPLVARITRDEPERLVHWELRGFFRGEGEVRFAPSGGGVLVSGFEQVTTAVLGRLAPGIERRLVEPRFRAIWAQGWRRLRREHAAANAEATFRA